VASSSKILLSDTYNSHKRLVIAPHKKNPNANPKQGCGGFCVFKTRNPKPEFWQRAPGLQTQTTTRRALC